MLFLSFRRKEPPVLVNATSNLIPCAVVVEIAHIIFKKRHAHSVVSHQQRSESITGAKRESVERPPDPAECAT